LTELLNIWRFKQASLVVHHIRPENLSTLITLYVAFIFFCYYNTILPYCQQ